MIVSWETLNPPVLASSLGSTFVKSGVQPKDTRVNVNISTIPYYNQNERGYSRSTKIKKRKKENNLNRSIRSIIPVLFPSIGKLQNCPNYFPNHNGRLLSLAVSVVLFLTIRSVVRSRWRSSKAPDPIGRRRSVKIRSVRVLSSEKQMPARRAFLHALARGWQSTAITLKGRNANIKPLYWID